MLKTGLPNLNFDNKMTKNTQQVLNIYKGVGVIMCSVIEVVKVEHIL